MNIASQVTAEDIESLSETQFTKLLTNLLSIETSDYNMFVKELSISSKQNTADDGEDGRCELDEQFPTNQFIRYHKNFYQIKAYDIKPSDCAKEILYTDDDNIEKVKPVIAEAVNNRFAYIWCIKKNLSPKSRAGRITKTVGAFATHGMPKATVSIIDADYLKDWVNKYPSIIIFVKFCKNQNFNGIQWLEQCPEYKLTYQQSSAMDEFRDEVLDYVKDPNSTGAIRIIGNSGIGKSHFIINTLSQDAHIKSQCLYINCSDHSNMSHIIDLINHYKSSRCILILDNCSLQNHKRIQAQKSESESFKLISIDSNLEEDSYPEYSIINIIPDNQVEAVNKILDHVIVGHNRDMYLNLLTEYCDGYPLLANKLSLAIHKYGLDGLDIATLIDPSSVNKWLFEKIPELTIDNLKKVITGLSFFSYINFTGNATFSETEKAVANEQFEFLTKYFFDKLPQKEFKKICTILIRLNFLEQKGTLIAVRPLPLAAYMIKDAINSNYIDLDDDFRPALQELTCSMSPHIKSLEVSLILQLKKIVTSGLKNVIDVVNTVFGIKSPFSKAENILTSRGSSILRHLTDIDPQLVIQLINNVTVPSSLNDLMQISGQVRRNIIWAIESLCFYENTFADGAKLLLRFAAAENESIANNATGQFAHLFQLFLPGTEANYAERVKVINWALNHEEQQYFIPILLKAITRAFYYRGGFTGNPRSPRDTKHLNEYKPKTHQEIVDYWGSLLNLIINNFDVFTVEMIYKAFNDAIMQTLIENKYYDYIERFLGLFDSSNLVAPYSELINTLKRLKEYNQDIDISKIDDLLNRLQPNDLIGRIKTQIINPSYGFGEYALLEKDKCVLEIAQALLVLSETNKYYEVLTSTDSWVTSELGMKIGQLDTQKAKIIFNGIINDSDLSSIKVSFVSGLLWGINDQCFITDCFKTLATKVCDSFIFNLAANIRINRDIFTILLEVKEKKNLSSDSFSRLNFSQVSNSERKWFIHNLLTLDSVGIHKVLDLLLHNINRREIESIEWIGYAEQVLNKTNVFLICNQNIIDYTLYAVLIKLIELKEDAVKIIAEQLNDYCAIMLNNYPPTYYWNNLFPILIDKCYDLIWNKYLGELFLQDWHGCFFIKHLLDLNSLINSESKSKLLLEWCIINKDRDAHILITRNISIFDENDQCTKFIINLIEYFQHDNKLLDAINSNMNEYFWSGDVSNYYLKCINQLDNMKATFYNNEFVSNWIRNSRENFELQYKSQKQREDEFKFIESNY